MTKEILEKQFTILLMKTDNIMRYVKLMNHYCSFENGDKPLNNRKQMGKLHEVQNGDPREWISKIFTEGLEMPHQLEYANNLWLRHLDEVLDD